MLKSAHLTFEKELKYFSVASSPRTGIKAFFNFMYSVGEERIIDGDS